MTIIRTEDAAEHTTAPANNETLSGDYQRIVAMLEDGTEKELWCGSKFTLAGYKSKCGNKLWEHLKNR